MLSYCLSIINYSNFDGYTNSIYTVTVAAMDRNFNHPMYSEMCPAILISMLSGENHNDGIVPFLTEIC